MKAAPFSYVRAGSVAEACEWLRRDGPDAKLIAGGQSLVPMMAMRLTRPRRLIDINEIAALKFVAIEAAAARTGACTRQCVVERDDALAMRAPLLRQALAWVGHTQTRNRGTVGGSLVHADPAAELPLVAQVLGATLVLRSGRRARRVPAVEFFTGPLMTSARPEECLEEIRWPVWPESRTGSAFTEVSRRHGDFALVAAAAQVALDEEGRCVRASFGIGGGGSAPRAFPRIAKRLVGTRLEEQPVKDAAREAAGEMDFFGDLHAAADYRKHLAAVLAERALRAARAQARAIAVEG
ncbi:MAG TPA: FAD binding domain-containing protein [Burkholderiales bacterium]|nr:FAD binding domain-containing protein [Burkholderiales bacterium]